MGKKRMKLYKKMLGYILIIAMPTTLGSGLGYPDSTYELFIVTAMCAIFYAQVTLANKLIKNKI